MVKAKIIPLWTLFHSVISKTNFAFVKQLALIVLSLKINDKISPTYV